jgi:UDP-2,4-diacetamido-2,4,6-trideoxy-beta-L-altropyranose hydrolase
MMNIAIRADASASRGLGHLKRCLALAQALRDLGASVSFFQRGSDVAGDALVTAHGFRSHELDPGDGADEVTQETADAQAFIDTCTASATTPNLVLVDHYALGAAWHTQVRRHTAARLAAIDDLADRPMAVDLLIDPNVAADHAAKHAATLPRHATLLGGPKFALLARAYATAPRCEPHDTVRSIGIFMGGTDEANLSELALTVLRNHVGFTGPVEIATTSGNPNLARLRRAADAGGTTRVTLDQPDLAAFFARHDLHLGAGGGATWERCCIGAPTLAMIAAPNQREVLLPLQFLGVVCVVTAEPPTHRDIADALRPLLINPARRRALATHARALVDGLGASRVAGHLLTP